MSGLIGNNARNEFFCFLKCSILISQSSVNTTGKLELNQKVALFGISNAVQNNIFIMNFIVWGRKVPVQERIFISRK